MPAVQPRKTSQQKTKKSQEVAQPEVVAPVVVAPVVAPVVVAPVAEKKTRAPRSKKVVEPVEEEQPAEPKVRAPRREVNVETVVQSFDELVKQVDEHITEAKSSGGSGTKFLRSLNKRLKTLKHDTERLVARGVKGSKKTRTKRENSNGGFMKPVKLSPEMYKFTGWDSTKEYSRVDVTKYICNYVKTHNLQDSADKRRIICDTKLTNLLKVDSKSGEQLTYFGIQKLLKPHFVKV
jgi:chromatin remodeling complex protein RSC6